MVVLLEFLSKDVGVVIEIPVELIHVAAAVLFASLLTHYQIFLFIIIILSPITHPIHYNHS